MKNPAKRTYIKRGICYLLISTAGAVGVEILKELGSKIFGKGKRRS